MCFSFREWNLVPRNDVVTWFAYVDPPNARPRLHCKTVNACKTSKTRNFPNFYPLHLLQQHPRCFNILIAAYRGCPQMLAVKRVLLYTRDKVSMKQRQETILFKQFHLPDSNRHSHVWHMSGPSPQQFLSLPFVQFSWHCPPATHTYNPPTPSLVQQPADTYRFTLTPANSRYT